jgi:hypothetical protein
MIERLIERLKDIPWGFWSALMQMAPYLLVGFAAAGLMSVLLPQTWVERHLGGRRLSAVLKAAALGVPMPLCSCSVIPVSASLRRHGAGRGATVAFLIATPQTGLDNILVVYGMLGGVFAVFCPILTLASAVVGGALVLLLAGKEEAAPAPHNPPGAPAGGKRGRHWLRRAAGYGFVTLPEDIGKAVLLGLLVAALIAAIVPPNYLAGVVPPGPAQIALVMLISLPIYVCSTASVPVAAALIAAGVSPGAALAFLITGPATNAATVATIWKVMGRRTTVIYLLTLAATAFGGGMLLNQVFASQGLQQTFGFAPAAHHVHETASTPWYAWPLAVTLLAVLGTGLVRPMVLRRRLKTAPAAKAIRLSVRGMTCNHCRQTVRGALLAVPGVEEAEVDLPSAAAIVQGTDVDAEALCRAVREAGYEAEPLPPQETDMEKGAMNEQGKQARDSCCPRPACGGEPRGGG